jgi:hypothetical protein
MVSMTVFSIFWLRPFFQILTLLATPIENGARSQLSYETLSFSIFQAFVLYLAISEAIALALQHYQAGRSQQAEQLCQQILQQQPTQVVALNLMGLLTAQRQQFDRAIALTVFVESMTINRCTNSDVFHIFIEQVLVPNLWKGACMSMDNFSAHKVKGICELIEAVGDRLIYLPPYSPDLNPIENC